MTTTNGTQALRACARAKAVFVAAFLNLRATAEAVDTLLGAEPQKQPASESGSFPNLLLVCSGTFDQAAYEDVLAAGALCDALWQSFRHAAVADSAQIARHLFHFEQKDLAAALKKSRNGQRLQSRPELAGDVDFCAQRDTSPLVVAMGRDGLICLA